LSTSCGRGTAKSFTKNFEEKSLQFIQKRQILDGETLTRATPTDAERELNPYSQLPPQATTDPRLKIIIKNQL